jgi:predicted glutamine amidotransferase
MCRFLAYWGEKSRKFTEWTISDNNCLLNQSKSDSSKRPNPDGWGFAYRNGNELTLIKDTNPAYEDAKYKHIADKINSDLLFAHVRRRSQGAISLANTHPFTHHEWIFMHNGCVPNFNSYKDKLINKLPKTSIVKTHGSTDSEFLFKYFLYWYKKFTICNSYSALNLIYNIIHEVINLTAPEEHNHLALNFMLTNGEFILGFRRNRSLHYSIFDDGILISSEIIDNHSQWNEVPENHFILAPNPKEVKIIAFDVQLKKQFFD